MPKGKAADVVPDQTEYSGSAINLPRTTWKFLRRVAEARSDLHGGRPSVSKVISDLIDQNRAALQKELRE